MPAQETAELTIQERGILGSSAAAASLDHFSKSDRRVVSMLPQPNLVDRQRTYYSAGQPFVIAWQDYGQPLPAWFDFLMQGLVDLLTLPPNWDSYDARPIEYDLVQQALQFTNGVLRPFSPAPSVVPLSSGGLQLEWHRKGIDLEIVFDQDAQPFFCWQDRVSGEESEHALPQDEPLLRSILARLE